jgi:hypothetical protein
MPQSVSPIASSQCPVHFLIALFVHEKFPSFFLPNPLIACAPSYRVFLPYSQLVSIHTERHGLNHRRVCAAGRRAGERGEECRRRAREGRRQQRRGVRELVERERRQAHSPSQVPVVWAVVTVVRCACARVCAVTVVS